MKERYHFCERVNCEVCGESVSFPNFNGAFSSTLNGELCYPCIEKNVKNPGSTNFTLVIPEVTELEHDVIMNGIAKSDFFNFSCVSDIPNGLVPSDEVIETCEITSTLQISGVVSSLVKKGLVLSESDGRNATLQLTAEGYWYYLNNR